MAKGMMKCEKCGEDIKTGFKKCPKCKESPKTQKASKQKTTKNNEIVPLSSLIESSGGVGAIKKAIADYDNVMKTIDAMGGIDKARANLDEIEKLSTILSKGK